MKYLMLTGLLAGALAVSSPAQAAQEKAGKARQGKAATTAAGHETPKQQPQTAPAPTAPTGDIALGSVRIPKSVKADGKPLAAGTYTVRVTSEEPSGDAKGQTKGLERWAEFLQGGKVKGREVVTIVPQSEIKDVQKDTPPKANGSKFETLKGGDYERLWINKGGNHYLVYFPTA